MASGMIYGCSMWESDESEYRLLWKICLVLDMNGLDDDGIDLIFQFRGVGPGEPENTAWEPEASISNVCFEVDSCVRCVERLWHLSLFVEHRC